MRGSRPGPSWRRTSKPPFYFIDNNTKGVWGIAPCSPAGANDVPKVRSRRDERSEQMGSGDSPIRQVNASSRKDYFFLLFNWSICFCRAETLACRSSTLGDEPSAPWG
jgi:hypothetical protein